MEITLCTAMVSRKAWGCKARCDYSFGRLPHVASANFMDPYHSKALDDAAATVRFLRAVHTFRPQHRSQQSSLSSKPVTLTLSVVSRFRTFLKWRVCRQAF